MSEQPKNLQDAPECPTDDEVLAKRDAEIEKLRKALANARTQIEVDYGALLESGCLLDDERCPIRGTMDDLMEGTAKEYEVVLAEIDAALSAVPETAGRNDRPETDGRADMPTREQLLDALLWIDTFEPETTAAAEAKFGFKLIS